MKREDEVDSVAALASYAKQQGWGSPLYEEIGVECYFNARIILEHESYSFRGVYPTYKKAKRATACRVLDQLKGTRREGIPPAAKVDAIVTAHRGEGAMRPDLTSTDRTAYFVCDDAGHSIDDRPRAPGAIYWMLFPQNEALRPILMNQRILFGVLWLLRQGCKRITLHLEASEDIVPIQVSLAALRIPFTPCGRRRHTIEIQLD